MIEYILCVFIIKTNSACLFFLHLGNHILLCHHKGCSYYYIIIVEQTVPLLNIKNSKKLLISPLALLLSSMLSMTFNRLVEFYFDFYHYFYLVVLLIGLLLIPFFNALRISAENQLNFFYIPNI